MRYHAHFFAFAMIFSFAAPPTRAQAPVELMPIGKAWAANSINAIAFRQDPIATHGERQYAAYYDADARVVIASRTLGQKTWEQTVTLLTGNIKDAHNNISIAVDGQGFLHIAWDHHGHPLRYAQGTAAGSTQFGEKTPMTGQNEANVTYPQFFRLSDGNLLFLFRDGASGRGNLVVNHYDAKAKQWTQRHANLISGENRRNAYWQACVDHRGSIHLAWVWRETGDVATNHDVCYARSDDGARTWKRSDGSDYTLPITAATAEIAAPVPQKHELINQTSICADGEGRPIIATYFRPQGSPADSSAGPGEKVVQYYVIRHDGKAWQTHQVTRRKTAFSLSGVGSKQIPIARPQVIARSREGKTSVWMIYRDVERDSRVSVASCANIAQPKWEFADLTDFSVRYWEPSFDRTRWERDGVLDLYVQMTGQGDAEGLEAVEPQPAYVLEWTPQ
jgi:hypothetical protein